MNCQRVSRYPERGFALLWRFSYFWGGPRDLGKSGELWGNLSIELEIHSERSSWEVAGEHLGKLETFWEVQGVSRRSVW